MKRGLICKPSKYSFSVGERVYNLMGNAMLEYKIAEYMGKKGYSIEEIGKKADEIFIVGGDGTILMTLMHTSKPIFPINTGRIGFLTEVEAKDAEESIKKILMGEYYIEERIKLGGKIGRKSLPNASNEITIHTASVGKILSIKLYVDDILTQSFSGDGLIISTPMGSTSYSLSAGGPIADPTLKIFIISPIAPFRHIASSIVIPASKKLKIKVAKPAKVVVDGMQVYDFSPRQKLEIFEAEERARFIKIKDNFYSKVYRKLSFRYPKSL